MSNKKRHKPRKKKSTAKYSLFRRELFQNPKQLSNKLYSLKYECSYGMREHFIDKIHNGNAPGYSYIFANLVSDSLHDINKRKNVILFNPNCRFRNEMEWAYLIIKKFEKKIQTFIALKEKYEKSLVLGNITEAQSAISEINESVSFSVWGCEQELLLGEIDGGFVGNKKLLSKTAEKTNNYLMLLLIDFYSYKAEIDSSHSNFNHHLNNFIEKSHDDFLTNYLNFKLKSFYDFEGFAKLEGLHKVICIESLMSIIDLYETYIKICMIIVSSQKSVDNFSVSNILNQTANLASGINDYRINKIQLLSGNIKSLPSKSCGKIEAGLYIALDYYTLGNYEACINEIKDNFHQVCNIFESIELISKCLVHLNKNIEDYFDENYGFLIKNLLQPIYNILICEDKEKSLKIVMNTIKTMGNSLFRDCLSWFCLRHVADYNADKLYFKRMAFLNSRIKNPLSLFCYSERKEQLQYLEKIESIGLCTKTCELFKSYLNNSFDKKLLSEMPKLRKDFYQAKSISDYDLTTGLERLEYLIEGSLSLTKLDHSKDNKLLFFYYERVASCLYELYLRSEKIEKALSLFIDSYLMNNSLVLRMNKNKLKEQIDKSRTNFESNIQVVVFDYLFDSSNHSQTYISLANYLDFNNLSLPSDLISFSGNVPDHVKEINFILHKIYTKEIMKRFVRLNPNDRSKERIYVLEYLIKNKNEKTYIDEINEIIKEDNIKEKIKLVDEKKIFVDTKSILSEFDEVFSEKFIRYKKLKGLDLDFYDLEKHHSKINVISEKISEELNDDRGKKQRYIAFKELFLDYLNEFLYNPKYGLDKFLSSRIRHGILENNLSKSFKDYNLLSFKFKKDDIDYNINEYWDMLIQQFPYYENQIHYLELKLVLSNFSKKIIDKIIEAYNWVRINDEKHPTGMFDYKVLYSDTYLTSIYGLLQKNNNFTSFFNELEKLVWAQTETIVESIRDRIDSELYDYFLNSLNELKTNVTSLKIHDTVSKEIISKIKLCKTMLKTDLQTTIKWFYVRKSEEYQDFYFDELVRTCLEINSKVNNTYESLDINFHVERNIYLTGDSFYYLYDTVNILYTNAIQHSGIKNYNQLNISIHAKSMGYSDFMEYLDTDLSEYSQLWADKIGEDKSPTLCLKISNDLGNDLNPLVIQKKVENAIQMFNKYDESKEYVSKEGGTGLIKINTILKFNIPTPAYLHVYYIKNNRFNAEVFINLKNILATKEN
ncbi:MAG: hypothetical protein KKE62_05095 [Proteobacteria bacterium]|nr:hypothetical protein [Pseudomonadota bacterium]MBU1388140.1 hypothetical protein [Pseudomonadota bacterium]MBU1542204.1 hypothetical protein [Pseudomonadota bacterium]